jgi:hypothetical protein
MVSREERRSAQLERAKQRGVDVVKVQEIEVKALFEKKVQPAV